MEGCYCWPHTPLCACQMHSEQKVNTHACRQRHRRCAQQKKDTKNTHHGLCRPASLQSTSKQTPHKQQQTDNKRNMAIFASWPLERNIQGEKQQQQTTNNNKQRHGDTYDCLPCFHPFPTHQTFTHSQRSCLAAVIPDWRWLVIGGKTKGRENTARVSAPQLAVTASRSVPAVAAVAVVVVVGSTAC